MIRQLHSTLLVHFLMTNGFYKDCKTALTYLFEWLVTNVSLQLKLCVLRCLPLMGTNSLTYNLESYLTLKGSDIILGLFALDKLEVGKHPSLDSFTMEDFTI